MNDNDTVDLDNFVNKIMAYNEGHFARGAYT